MRRALLVGIDEYYNSTHLQGCANDVEALEPLLASHENDDPNFHCRKLTSENRSGLIDAELLLQELEFLLAPGADVCLFYFAGHGKESNHDLKLVTQGPPGALAGVHLAHILGLVQDSKVPEVFFILDCCFSGAAGGVPQLVENVALLREGFSLLTSSRSDQKSAERPGFEARGLFSIHLCGALDGGAADVLGKVTAAGLYAYLSESFGPWFQRPVFKCNLDRLHDLRRCSPAVPKNELRRLVKIFGNPEADLPLDPSYEPDAKPKNEHNEEIFGVLQRCRAAKLVEPIGTEHMYYAAMERKSCRLTPLGKHYWRMAKEKRF